jgi:hypothetical protein
MGRSRARRVGQAGADRPLEERTFPTSRKPAVATAAILRDIEAEVDAFHLWAKTRRKPSYADKVACFLDRMLRGVRTSDPTEDQVASWFADFRSEARNSKGGYLGRPPRNGTVRAAGFYIKLYSRFRVSQGRRDGIAGFVDEVICQYRDDDSERDEPLTPDERKAIIDAALRMGDEGFALYLRVVYELAGRAESVLRIRSEDLHPETRTVSLANEKQGYNRTGWISQSLMEDLLALRRRFGGGDAGHVFPNRSRSHNVRFQSQPHMNYWTAARRFNKYARHAGIRRKVHLHLNKASRITDLFAAGATPAEVSKLTRTSLQTLMRYTRPKNEQVLSSFDNYSDGYI